MANKADTSINDLINLVKTSCQDPKSFNKLANALTQLIPIQSKRRIKMPDKNLNKVFRIKRINHTIIAKVISLDDNMYEVQVISSDNNQHVIGDTLPISKRELELTGKPTSSLSL
ncbi:MAG: hypothetical protein WCT77_01895 [Bacteroidota bacterium]|jgi:hypothetical protein